MISLRKIFCVELEMGPRASSSLGYIPAQRILLIIL